MSQERSDDELRHGRSRFCAGIARRGHGTRCGRAGGSGDYQHHPHDERQVEEPTDHQEPRSELPRALEREVHRLRARASTVAKRLKKSRFQG